MGKKESPRPHHRICAELDRSPTIAVIREMIGKSDPNPRDKPYYHLESNVAVFKLEREAVRHFLCPTHVRACFN